MIMRQTIENPLNFSFLATTRYSNKKSNNMPITPIIFTPQTSFHNKKPLISEWLLKVLIQNILYFRQSYI